jgi:hypothetical protein
MKKFLTTLAVLTAFATPAVAQSFDPDAGTGNVMPFAHTPTAIHNHKVSARQSGLHSFAMVPGRSSVFNRKVQQIRAAAASATMKCSVSSESDEENRAGFGLPSFLGLSGPKFPRPTKFSGEHERLRP